MDSKYYYVFLKCMDDFTSSFNAKFHWKNRKALNQQEVKHILSFGSWPARYCINIHPSLRYVHNSKYFYLLGAYWPTNDLDISLRHSITICLFCKKPILFQMLNFNLCSFSCYLGDLGRYVAFLFRAENYRCQYIVLFLFWIT